jgi:beta-alanine--pyruvate transaminase
MPDIPRVTANDLGPYWMPFTANRQFKAAPRMFVAAEGMYYTTEDGRQVLDGISGMWCVNAGHGRRRIAEAIKAQADRLDYSTAFQMGHPLAFALAARLTGMLPDGLDRVFFACSGSEAVDTALKIALAYHRARGEGTRTRFIGRERGYHGVGFGGTAVGGIPNNRKQFGNMLGGVDHLRHTHDPARNAFSRGQPEHGADLAEDLARLVALHDASTVAAVIVEPMAGSTGVLVPPVGYLERLRAICDAHGILLILDEVITGFGRLGAGFAAEKFGIRADMMTLAKGLTNGAVPMSAVAVQGGIYDAVTDAAPEGAVELFHGYTYSAHPLACAAGLAALDIYAGDGLFDRAGALAPYFEDAIHGLKGLPHVVDIRDIGLVGAVELAPRDGAPGARGYDVFRDCFEAGVLVRQTGDIIALAPPLIVERDEIDRMTETLAAALRRVA